MTDLIDNPTATGIATCTPLGAFADASYAMLTGQNEQIELRRPLLGARRDARHRAQAHRPQRPADRPPSTSHNPFDRRSRRFLSMSASHNPNIDLQVSRGGGPYLQINARTIDDTYGAIVMAELAALRDKFPAVRVDVHLRAQTRPTPAQMARLINTELDRNEIWD
jgi:hypothetical protein